MPKNFTCELADPAERSHELRRLDRKQDGLRVRRSCEFAQRLDIFLGDEIVDCLSATAFDRIADGFGR